MRYTTFGRTGLTVSRLSMGCNRLGDPGVDPAQWPPIVRRALDLGVTFFDTSNSYNQGRSEEVLGEVTSASPHPTVIATKGGVPVETNDYPNRDFHAETILAAANDSLQAPAPRQHRPVHAPQPDRAAARDAELGRGDRASSRPRARSATSASRRTTMPPASGPSSTAPTSSRSSTTCWTRPPRTR